MSDGSVTIEVTLTKEQLEKGLKSVKSDLNSLNKSSVGKVFDGISQGLLPYWVVLKRLKLH